MKFVFLDEDDIIKDKNCLEPLYKLGTVDIYSNCPKSEKEILNRAIDADVIFFALTKFSNNLLDKLPKLKILQFLGTGMWNLVDVKYASKKGIKVLNIESYGNNAVAEYTIACAFSLARNILSAVRKMHKKIWNLEGLEGIEIQSSTFGIVGTGNIGKLVAKKAAVLGAKVLAYDIVRSKELEKDFGVKYTSLEKLFSESDFISIHLKAIKNTYKLINKKLINSMKENAFFINAARAEVVDNEALFEALANKKIKGAALDVFECEPPNDYRLIKLDNVIATPHIGFYTNKSSYNMLIMSINSVINALS